MCYFDTCRNASHRVYFSPVGGVQKIVLKKFKYRQVGRVKRLFCTYLSDLTFFIDSFLWWLNILLKEYRYKPEDDGLKTG